MLRPHWLSIESYGLLIVLLSAVLYAIAGAFVKLGHIIGGLPSTEMVFARGIFQGSLVVLGLYMGRDEKTGHRLIRYPFGRGPAAQKVVFARGVLGGAGFLFDYHCMAVLPLGDAITLMSLYPFLTVVLAYFYLGEEIRRLQISVITASMVGAVFIAQPTFLFGRDEDIDAPALGYVTGLLGACCLACVVNLIRKGGTIGVTTNQLLLSWALCGILFSLMFGNAEGKWEYPASRQVWWYVFGVCSVGAAAHFLLNYAGRLAPAGMVSVVRASDIVWAYACEIYVFHQEPNTFTWVGVLLVLGSLVAIGIDKVRDGRQLMKKLSSSELDEKEEGEEDCHVEMEEGKAA